MIYVQCTLYNYIYVKIYVQCTLYIYVKIYVNVHCLLLTLLSVNYCYYIETARFTEGTKAGFRFQFSSIYLYIYTLLTPQTTPLGGGGEEC